MAVTFMQLLESAKNCAASLSESYLLVICKPARRHRLAAATTVPSKPTGPLHPAVAPPDLRVVGPGRRGQSRGSCRGSYRGSRHGRRHGSLRVASCNKGHANWPEGHAATRLVARGALSHVRPTPRAPGRELRAAGCCPIALVSAVALLCKPEAWEDPAWYPLQSFLFCSNRAGVDA